MPPPGFPDWLGPGAIVIEAATHNRDSSEIRYTVTDVEMELPSVPWDGGERSGGGYVDALMELNYDAQEVVQGSLHTVNLSAFLDLYQWTGEYLTPEGTITSTGTTLPVTMHMGALQPGQRLVIQGSSEHDGMYWIETVSRHVGAANGLDLRVVVDNTEVEQMLNEPLLREEIRGFDGFDPDMVMPHDPDTTAVETNIPFVAADQVWQLPRPNGGLWRTSRDPTNAGNWRLTHARERDRVMTCTATWLVTNGVRQTPPDPRTGGQNGTGIAIGQVWEFKADAGSRYQRCPRWRVREINGTSELVMLMAEDGSGKRIYLPPARILELATYAGDGLPRRTAYEHILEADD